MEPMGHVTNVTGPKVLGSIAQALAWVLAFSAVGGLKDLKKRSIRHNHMPRSFRPQI
jgi:hypothetical protein